MTKDRLNKIKYQIESFKAGAENVMDGGDNYDGADGARYIIEICSMALELIQELENV